MSLSVGAVGFTVLISLALGEPRAEAVLVVMYQAEGISPQQRGQALDGARDEVRDSGLSVAVSESVVGAATLCGEEAGCLAELGRRADARWVLSIGLARVGSTVVVSTTLVDARTAQRLAQETFVAGAAEDTYERLRLVGRRLLGARPLSLPDAKPVAAELKPVRPRTVGAPARHGAGPWQAITLSATGAFLAGAVVTTVLAGVNYGALSRAGPDDFEGLASRQRGLNWAADLLSLGTIAAGGASLYVILGPPSRGESQPEVADSAESGREP